MTSIDTSFSNSYIIQREIGKRQSNSTFKFTELDKPIDYKKELTTFDSFKEFFRTLFSSKKWQPVVVPIYQGAQKKEIIFINAHALKEQAFSSIPSKITSKDGGIQKIKTLFKNLSRLFPAINSSIVLEILKNVEQVKLNSPKIKLDLNSKVKRTSDPYDSESEVDDSESEVAPTGIWSRYKQDRKKNADAKAMLKDIAEAAPESSTEPNTPNSDTSSESSRSARSGSSSDRSRSPSPDRLQSRTTIIESAIDIDRIETELFNEEIAADIEDILAAQESGPTATASAPTPATASNLEKIARLAPRPKPIDVRVAEGNGHSGVNLD